jgi:protein involved in polysaccharide export with SLBB domain
MTLPLLTGCYTPLHSYAVPAVELPDYYRMPQRSVAPTLNLAKLTVPPPQDYILGPNDTLDITVPDLFQGAEIRPIRSRIMADGTVTLPLVGQVVVGGMNLSAAQDAINQAYANGFLNEPRVSVALAEKHTISVSVIGEVTNPGVYQLPRYENDVGHALALAGGFEEFAAEVVEVHRRISRRDFEAKFLAGNDGVVKMSHATKGSSTAADAETGATTEQIKPAASRAEDGATNTRRRTPRSRQPAARLSGAVEADLTGYRHVSSTPEAPAFAHCSDSSVRRDSQAASAPRQGFLHPIQQTGFSQLADEGRAPLEDLKADDGWGADNRWEPVNAGQPLDGTHAAGPMAGGFPIDEEIEIVLRVPLRGGPATVNWEGTTAVVEDLTAKDVTLQSGDVVLIPRQEDEVFFVVGPLDRTNVVNFTIRARDRQLGNAFLIPPDRDIDVVTAVAMAGYIDPINSPDTVTVHRQVPGCPPMLITVDLIDARYNWRENVYVQPGDILYLNPDGPWWFRRTFDRIIPVLLTAPYIEAMMFWIPE